MKIINIRTNSFGEIVGRCKERKVKWSWSVNLWYFVDTRNYIFDAIEY